MTKRAQKYDCLTGRIRAIVFCTIGITLLFGWADAYNALTTNDLQQNLRENSLNASVKGNKSPMDSLLSFSSLMLSQNLSQESKSPVSSVYVSHITSVPPAGERHAFSFEEDRSQETEDRMLARRNSRNSGNTRHFERTSTGGRGKSRTLIVPMPSFRAQRSGVEKSFHAEASRREKNLTQITQIFTENSVRRRIMLASERISRSREAELSRRKSRNSGNSRHFERSGAESRNPFMQKHRDREKNLTQITQIFTEIPFRRRIMLASERITRSREAELSRRKSRNSGNSRHFERSGAESRNPFTQKHREERDG